MTRNIYQSVLIFTALLLYSCEYHSAQDHFVEKKAPSENLDVSINLLEIPEGETIYIYTGTSLRYTLDISDKKLITINFELDGVKVSVFDNSYVFVQPIGYDDSKEHELKVKVELTSDSGSLAERLYLERYTGEFSFKVKYIKTDFSLNIRQEYTEDGFLKLMWDYLDFQQTPIEKYTISFYNPGSVHREDVDITNPQQTFFIDRDYTYGYCQYAVTVFFKDNKIASIANVHTAQYTELTAENLNLNIRQRYSSEGYLELLWDKPEINRMPVSKYLIEYLDEKLGGWQTIDIDNPDNTSYIDENYVYGQREYRFTVFLMDDRFKVSTKYSPTYRELTSDDLTFEDIDLENIRVSWPKPEFNCTKIIRLFDNENFLIPEGENFFIFKREELPHPPWSDSYYNDKIELYLVGKKTPFDINDPLRYSEVSISNSYLHKNFNFGSHAAFSPYPTENILYVVTPNGLYRVDMATMQKTKLNIADDVIFSSIDHLYSSKVASVYYNTVKLYKDHTFTNPVSFELVPYSQRRISLGFTADNKFMISQDNYYTLAPSIPIMFFNADTGDYLYTISVPTHGKIGELKASFDKKYIIAELYQPGEEASYFDIYKIENNLLTLVKSLSYGDHEHTMPSVRGHPLKLEQLILYNDANTIYGEYFEIVELPNFNKIAGVNGLFQCVDLTTGDYIYTKGEYLYIADPTLTTHRKICKYDLIDGGLFSFNNVIINAAGYYFDISNFIW